MGREIRVGGLPYRTRIYINSQVLLPSGLVKLLGIEKYLYADVVIRYEGKVIEIKGVKLLRNRRATSRQFTIPREIRETYGIKPLDEIEIIEVRPIESVDVRRGVSLRY
ncbi:MAG: AbrB/MazE/SpoVT family DNA-binding domain-containing protein [Vulcanisaeta sp.]